MKSRAGALKTKVDHTVYIFEGFRLDKGRRQLSSSGGVVVPLNSRAMEALVLLVSHAGELVTKKQLLEGVWPSAVVEDNNINQCILAIRKALGEVAGSNRFIMTVPGRGYRFVAPVIVQTRESPEPFAAEPARRGGAQGWKMLLVACLVVSALLLLAGIETNLPESGLQGVEPQELIVHLHRQVDDPVFAQAGVLRDCLRQRPDLHMMVEVRVVGVGSAQPVWKGEFIAGPQDVVDDSPEPSVPEDACAHLVGR